MNRLHLESQEACVLGAPPRRQAEEIPDAIYLMVGENRYSFGRVDELANSQPADFSGEILAEAGFSQAQIDALREAGVVD